MKCNLGCGSDYKEGYLNVDISNKDVYGNKIKVDKIIDLNKYPLPFEDYRFDEVYCSHVIEHLDNPFKFMMEVIRITTHCGRITISAPHFSSLTCHSDLTHKRPGLSYFTFGVDWVNQGINEQVYVFRKRFNFTRDNFKFLNYIINPIINLFPSLYERFFCYILPCSEVKFEMVKGM